MQMKLLIGVDQIKQNLQPLLCCSRYEGRKFDDHEREGNDCGG